MAELPGYDAWKLASPYDDEKECRICDAVFVGPGDLCGDAWSTSGRTLTLPTTACALNAMLGPEMRIISRRSMTII